MKKGKEILWKFLLSEEGVGGVGWAKRNARRYCIYVRLVWCEATVFLLPVMILIPFLFLLPLLEGMWLECSNLSGICAR